MFWEQYSLQGLISDAALRFVLRAAGQSARYIWKFWY